MKSSILCVTLIALFILTSCHQSAIKREKATEIFNEGIAINLESIEAQNKQDWERASDLNKQSIAKFLEAYEIDSSYYVIFSALGHCYYIDKQFDVAIPFFERYLKIDDKSAVSIRELGLCKINKGKIEDGKSDIDKAFVLDTSQTIRTMTIQDLEGISDLAFEYGDAYRNEGEIQKGKDYKNFSVIVLALAFEYNKNDDRIREKIIKLAKEIGNREMEEAYKKKI
ncbi:hypothetical protein DVR12_13935 [Chitinophaga silvatica]|uniref:Uncharacterized protein n=1 Tax=Chitinophaga silvatica TaxID=2282649 RepID=A0A3E1Y8M3_9BACT|nr:hypothetical protein [Chitinophaga silvatica]RFS21757.1 hypothetical protein DVR12_13935 [Chitinophaga silvatica]